LIGLGTYPGMERGLDSFARAAPVLFARAAGGIRPAAPPALTRMNLPPPREDR